MKGIKLDKFKKDQSPMFKLTFKEKPLLDKGVDSYTLISAKVKVWQQAQEIEKGPVSIQLLQSASGWWYINDILRIDEWPEELMKSNDES